MNRLLISERAVADRDFPRVGMVRDDIEGGMRIFPVGNYLILFRALEDGVEIVR
jgi:plasmid stabilization system protein ParE